VKVADMSNEQLDQALEYARFFKRALYTKMFEPKNIALQGQEVETDSPYLAAFSHTVSIYAQVKNISIEEANEVAFKELDKLDDKRY
jgi:hypothetical protein